MRPLIGSTLLALSFGWHHPSTRHRGGPLRAGGTLHPRPTRPRDFSRLRPVIDRLADGAALPKLIVFDLDNTLWTPELYTLRHLAGYRDARPPGPEAGRDVWLVDGAADVLWELATHARWRAAPTALAVASRTNKGAWARSLLGQFKPDGARPLAALLAHTAIFTGDKTAHFEQLRAESGVGFDDMVFFDDARDGKFGNCERVARLGVLSVHTPRGLSAELFTLALEQFAALKAAGEPTGVVLPARAPPPAAAAQAAEEGAVVGEVTKWLEDRAFGFVRVPGRAKDVFFHRRALRGDAPPAPRPRDRVRVTVRADAQGRAECASVELLDAAAPAEADGVTLRAFSMNLPFAALLAHGYKEIESRNGTMFRGTEGQRMLLHVGQRTYPDGGAHRVLMRENGLSDQEIDDLTALPPKFKRGQAVALLDIGATHLVEDVRERSLPLVERQVVARGDVMGRYHTRITGVQWLREGVPMRGQPGVFDAFVPTAALPPEFTPP